MNRDFAVNQKEIQSYIEKYSDGKSPITAQDVIDVSAKYGIPVEFILAQGRLESNFGTKGRAARTNNIYNIANYTSGDTMLKDSAEQKAVSREMSGWVEGLEVYARELQKNYMPKDGNWNKLLDDEFVNKDGNRYAEDSNYEKTLKSLISGIYKLNTEKSVSSQEQFDAEAARKEYNY
jgi:flagellum-specific peptidoglycan hydrolase FlgJ